MTFPPTVAYVLFGKQTTYLSAVSPTKDVGLILKDVGMDAEREVLSVQGVGDINASQVVGQNETHTLSLSGEFQHGRIMEIVFGTVAHAQTSSDWKHTYTVSSTTLYGTFAVGTTLGANQVENTMDGAFISSCKIRHSLNENLFVSYDFDTRTNIPDAVTTSGVVSSLAVFPSRFTTVTINGSSATEVQEVEVEITKTAATSGGLGSTTKQQGHAVSIEYKYRAKLGFTTKAYDDLFYNITSHAFVLNSNNGVGLGSGRREFNISLANCLLTLKSKPISVGNLIFVDVEGIGTLNECFSVDNISSGSW